MEGLSVAPVVDALGAEGQFLKLLRGQKLQGCHPERAEIGNLFGNAVKGSPLNHAAVLCRGKAAHMQAVDDALPRTYLRGTFILPGELAQKSGERFAVSSLSGFPKLSCPLKLLP